MKKRSAFIVLAALASALATVTTNHQAKACGGCFHPPTQNVSDITDERMLLSVTTQQTTLYDQIRYSGTPSQFAWVLPIRGTVDVGLSADVLFDTIDALTTTQITPPENNCPVSSGGVGCSSSNTATADFAPNREGTVVVTKQENVGPYETVQLHSTDPAALNTWLSQNGFVIPDDVTTIIDQYVGEGFDFLAMKLLPNQGVAAMRPVRVTMPGASLSLPLRMAAIGTGAKVGITIWVVADGRYELQNFPFFHIEDKELIWDWNTSSSNYAALRASNEAANSGRGWEIESSIDLNVQLIKNAILSGGTTSNYGGAGNGYTAPAEGDYLPVTTTETADAGTDAGGTQGDGGARNESADDVRNDDLVALFGGASPSTVRVTRMRSDIDHAAMTKDLILQASADPSELSNVRQVTRSVNEPQCASSGSCDTSVRPNHQGPDLFLLAITLVMMRLLRRRPAEA